MNEWKDDYLIILEAQCDAHQEEEEEEERKSGIWFGSTHHSLDESEEAQLEFDVAVKYSDEIVSWTFICLMEFTWELNQLLQWFHKQFLSCQVFLFSFFLLK